MLALIVKQPVLSLRIYPPIILHACHLIVVFKFTAPLGNLAMPDWRMIPARQYGLIVCKQKTYSMFSRAVRGWAVVLYSIASIAPHAPNYKSQALEFVTIRDPRVGT